MSAEGATGNHAGRPAATGFGAVDNHAERGTAIFAAPAAQAVAEERLERQAGALEPKKRSNRPLAATIMTISLRAGARRSCGLLDWERWPSYAAPARARDLWFVFERTAGLTKAIGDRR